MPLNKIFTDTQSTNDYYPFGSQLDIPRIVDHSFRGKLALYS
jgi:hypothetical protein